MPRSSGTNFIEVVAAVFQQADKVLVCRKRAGLPNAGLWEFPGGKRNPDESYEAALAREIEEELHVQIDAAQLSECSLGHHIHNAGSVTIELNCFMVPQWRGEFALTDHDQIKWCGVEELRLMELSAADVPFVDRIEAYFHAA